MAEENATMPSMSDKHAPFPATAPQPRSVRHPHTSDANTSHILTSLGFAALATTSAGYASSIERRDTALALSRKEVLQNARQIVEATHLMVAADLEDLFGQSSETCAEMIHLAAEVSLVEGLIGDATSVLDAPIFDVHHAVEWMPAATKET